jgi:hypothetical protein
MHARWVQAAVNALSSSLGVLINIAGWLPKRKICPLFVFTSCGFNAKVTVCAVDSSTAGGIRYLLSG